MTPRRTALILILVTLAAVLPVTGSTNGDWVFAYRPGCSECDRALPLVEAFGANHTEQRIEFLDLNQGQAAVARFTELTNRSGVRPHVPVLFAGDQVIMGSADIRAFLEGEHPTPTPALQNVAPLAPLAVASAGLVDGINPCAFAVLALLLGTLTVVGTRRRVLTIGAAYTLGVFACYLGAGFGITAIVGAMGVGPLFRLIAGGISLVVGIAVLGSSVLDRRDLAPAISIPGRERVAGWLQVAPTAGPIAALALGIGVGLVELPCTGGIYLGVLGLLAGGALSDAVPLLVLYNLFFVLPLVLIIGAVAYGLPPSSVDRWRGSRRRFVLGVSGLVMIVLGLSLLAMELL